MKIGVQVMFQKTPNSLFKYYAPETGINHVLQGGTIKWSTPEELNDPFDNQFELDFDEVDDVEIDSLLDDFFENDFSSVEFRKGDMIISGEEFGNALRQWKLLISPQEKTELKNSLVEGIENVKNYMPIFKQEFMAEMKRTAIFCMSESSDSVLMWSFYAQNHTGIAIEFAPNHFQSPLSLSRPVQYVTDVPKLTFRELFRSLSNRQAAIEQLIRTFTLTKSEEWSHEKEWRVVVAGGSGIRPFFSEDINAVYMGCRMSQKDQDRVKAIVRATYPNAKLFLASKSPTDFALRHYSVE